MSDTFTLGYDQSGLTAERTRAIKCVMKCCHPHGAKCRGDQRSEYNVAQPPPHAASIVMGENQGRVGSAKTERIRKHVPELPLLGFEWHQVDITIV